MLNFNVYNTEILRFLHTLTIKYDPFVDIYNAKYSSIVDEFDPSTYPYYINVQGMYHSLDTPVMTSNGIIISKESLDQHELLRISFKNDFTRLYNLYNDYPSQCDIIRASIWPVHKTTQEIIDADNMTLLGYDTGYLDSNEREDIIFFVQELLTVLRDRWFNPYYDGEDQFHAVWWSCMWYILYFGIHTRRIMNIQQEAVHNMHITEELRSHGFSECKLMLNRVITKFLYKNHRYLDKHKGKNTLLEIIDEHLLSKVGYTLNKYKIFKQVDPLSTSRKWEPEAVLSSLDNVVDKDNVINMENFRNILIGQRLVPSEINEIELKMRNDKITNNMFNEFDTKYLFLNKSSETSIYSDYYYAMVFELLVSLWDSGSADIRFNFETEIMNTDFDVNVSSMKILDMIYMFHYCINKAAGNEVIYLPTSFDHCLSIVKYEDLNIPDDFYFEGKRHLIRSYVDVDQIVSDMFGNIERTPVYTRADMYDYMKGVYNTTIQCIQNVRASGDLLRCIAYQTILSHIFSHREINITDPESITTYEEYFLNRTDLGSIINLYPSNEDMMNIANNIVSNIIHIDDDFSMFVKRTDNNSSLECLINIAKRFVSYNVNFISSIGVEADECFDTHMVIGDTEVIFTQMDSVIRSETIVDCISGDFIINELLTMESLLQEGDITIDGSNIIILDSPFISEIESSITGTSYVQFGINLEEIE